MANTIYLAGNESNRLSDAVIVRHINFPGTFWLCVSYLKVMRKFSCDTLSNPNRSYMASTGLSLKTRQTILCSPKLCIISVSARSV